MLIAARVQIVCMDMEAWWAKSRGG